jgi:hypothetical protein
MVVFPMLDEADDRGAPGLIAGCKYFRSHSFAGGVKGEWLDDDNGGGDTIKGACEPVLGSR